MHHAIISLMQGSPTPAFATAAGSRSAFPQWQLPAALAAVWLLFGGAFIAGKVGVTAIPPFLWAAPRFLIAGTMLLAWAAWRAGGLAITRRELLEGTAIGLLTIAAGQGSTMWGMTLMSPGLVAVINATLPLWLSLLSLLLLRRGIPTLGVVGLITSFIGAVLLASPSGAGTRVLPFVVVSLGIVAWAGGALLANRSHVARRPPVLAGLQMLIGGIGQLLTAAVLGELESLRWTTALTVPVISAFVFSVLGASIVGFTSYAWLLRNTPPMIANSNAYVSPVIAIFLSWLILGEPLGPRTIGLAAMVLFGVALLIWAQGRISSAAEVR
jgi:drug/metabolite transporter (DMT)-like permease